MNRRISVRAMVLLDNKLLCVRQQSNNLVTQPAGGVWNLPGGGLDTGESLIECLKREIIEETGIEAIIGNLMYIQQFQFNNAEYLEFFFNVTNSEDYLDIDLSKTTHGEIELLEIGFVDPKHTNILPKFLMTEPISDRTNSPTTVISYL